MTRTPKDEDPLATPLRRRGRPSKLTRGLLDKFELIAEHVACVDDAAAELGIGPATYRGWMRTGRDARAGTLHAQFRAIALGSRLRQKNRLLSMLYKKALEGDIPAAKYLLDRIHRLAIVVEHSGPEGGPIGFRDESPAAGGDVDYSKLSAEQKDTLHKILAEATIATARSDAVGGEDGDGDE